MYIYTRTHTHTCRHDNMMAMVMMAMVMVGMVMVAMVIVGMVIVAMVIVGMVMVAMVIVEFMRIIYDSEPQDNTYLGHMLQGVFSRMVSRV